MKLEHEILFDSELEEPVPYEELIAKVISSALEEEGVTVPCEVSVLFTDDGGIHAINLEQRGVDSPTDVLSFPMFEFDPGDPPTEENSELDPGSDLLPLGDMVLNLDRTRQQAEEFGHSVERELGYLTVHSVLHLLGYDHMDDGPMKAQMRAREEQILGKLGITRD